MSKEEKDYIDRIYNLTSTERDEALLDMRIDFSNKYLPSDKEETLRRIRADMALSSMLVAYERAAFRDGFKAAEKGEKCVTQSEFNIHFNKLRNDLNYDINDIRFELAQICSVMRYITEATFEIMPATKEINDVGCSLQLITDTLTRTHKKLEVITGFSDPDN